ncbi:hypothetical protein NP233_g5933 [Leucocoprinus birnbaumii]|uniref:SWIM-type domain-containing protein n=1 Tax=Leucocoprinus birnbaumii TaxID=56174 RepID=A0AAD5YU42_9AGAR|nr:hypothetical protein NP233_g5933 [Leucocoprinus birnbaumii]
MENFEDYSTPPAHSAFSFAFYQSLTFGSLETITFPLINKSGSLIHWCFDKEVPASAEGSIILPGETIPHYNDLRPIILALKTAFSQGFRSVAIQMSGLNGEPPLERLYHFKKIRLFIEVNNHVRAISYASRLVNTIKDGGFGLSNDHVNGFLSTKISHQACGFLGSISFPLWKLGCLFDEEWLEEDIANAYLELIYFTDAASKTRSTKQEYHPSSIILPTLFLSNIQHDLWDGGNPVPGSACVNLRSIINSPTRTKLAALICTNNHFTAYRSIDFVSIEFGDSLGGKSQPHINAALEWSASTSRVSFMKPICGGVNIQGPRSGSCGIAALNFIHCGIDPQVEPWSPQNSSQMRREFLFKLIFYHSCATSSLINKSQWTVESKPLASNTKEDFISYEDFNLHTPTIHHPIHSFLAALPHAYKRGQAPLPLPLPSTLHLKLQNKVVTPIDIKIEPLDKAATLSLPQFIDLTTPSPIQSIKQESPVIKLDDSPCRLPLRDIIDLTNSPVALKSERPGFKFAVLDSDNSDAEASVISIKQELPVVTPSTSLSRPTVSQVPRILQVRGNLRLHSAFKSFEEAEEAVYTAEGARGFPWRRAQSQKDENGVIKKRTLRCSSYHKALQTHSDKVDPGDHRRSKSIRCGCAAHVNVRLQNGGIWTLTTVHLEHNHPPIGRRTIPPSAAQKKLVAQYATQPKFERSHIKKILDNQFEDHPLERRQITNIMNAARREARAAVTELGGDFPAVLAHLQSLSQNESGWDYRPRLDESNTVVALWWQSPAQADLARRYWDILINDTAYNRNVYSYPLNIGIVIDNFGRSRNVWYCLQKSETIASHTWVLQNHLDTARQPPEVFASDRHISLCKAVPSVLPFTYHIYCLHHLGSNVHLHLRSCIDHDKWSSFCTMFWRVYRAASPDMFDRRWKELLAEYPAGRSYLEEELYPCRQRWAWAWLSRRSHVSNLEALFAHILKLLRQYAGPFALQRCYEQMTESMFYSTELIQRPPDSRDWNQLVIDEPNESDFDWKDNEQNKMLNTFINDDAHITSAWLFNLINNMKVRIHQIFKITHQATGVVHYLVRLDDDRCICDCCMGMNLGIPCRHFFNAWVNVHGLPFHMGLIRARWYKDPQLDLSQISAATRMGEIGSQELRLRGSLASASNPIEWAARRGRGESGSTPPRTQTIGAREVHQVVQSAFRPLLAGIRTQEQVEEFVDRMLKAQELAEAEERAEVIHDPLTVKSVGRPRTARLTGAVEGRPRGGGPTAPRLAPGWVPGDNTGSEAQTSNTHPQPPLKTTRVYKCGNCGQQGHGRHHCPSR